MHIKIININSPLLPDDITDYLRDLTDGTIEIREDCLTLKLEHDSLTHFFCLLNYETDC